MPENEMIEAQDGQTQGPETTPPAETGRERFERERLSRRAALRKMGVTTAMSVFALFSVDDLARLVGRAMQQRHGDSRIAEQVAREFQQAGIAMASGSNTNPSSCQNCVTTKQTCVTDADTTLANCLKTNSQDVSYCNDFYYGEKTECAKTYSSCCQENNCNC